MTMERRRPFTWVTWITGLLAGDDQCEFAAWFKVWHQGYAKRSRDGGASLSKWKAEHADAVKARVAECEEAGDAVYVEGQNRFIVKGGMNTLSCGPDIVRVLGEEAVVEDAKTGARKDGHVWQVLIYMMFLPTLHPALKTDAPPLRGRLLYKDGVVEIPAAQADAVALARVGKLMRRLASRESLPATPSAAECQYCDIDECPHRIEGDVPEARTEAF